MLTQAWWQRLTGDPAFELPVIRRSGLTPYDVAWDEMRRRQEAVVAGDDAAQALLVVEHPPTITRGRGLQLRQAPLSPESVVAGVAGLSGAGTDRQQQRQMPLAITQLSEQVIYREIERGGDLTAHEPGQLVLYPVMRLNDRDLGRFLRGFEGAVIDFLNGLEGRDYEALSVPDSSGVWVRGPRWAQPRKIASLGVSVRSWVTMHGMALNVCNTLETFRWIQPCGYAPEAMITLDEVAPGWCLVQ